MVELLCMNYGRCSLADGGKAQDLDVDHCPCCGWLLKAPYPLEHKIPAKPVKRHWLFTIVDPPGVSVTHRYIELNGDRYDLNGKHAIDLFPADNPGDLPRLLSGTNYLRALAQADDGYLCVSAMSQLEVPTPSGLSRRVRRLMVAVAIAGGLLSIAATLLAAPQRYWQWPLVLAIAALGTFVVCAYMIWRSNSPARPDPQQSKN